MKANLIPLQNRGMSRDLSVSKAGNDTAWENHNIRVTPRDHDTLLSVTNERGTKEISLPEGSILGKLIGWNVLNNHIILFTTETEGEGSGETMGADGLSVYPQSLSYETEGGEQTITVVVADGESWTIVDGGGDSDSDNADSSKPDRIYRIDYDGNGFRMVRGDTDDDGVDADSPEYGKPIFEGNLGFDMRHPIESIVSYEAANIQKIYWLDGKHVLRFLNFMETRANISRWNNTYFDSNRAAKGNISVTISKSNSGNNRANGVAQYIVTYYNQHGQETGYVWVSDLVYLSPVEMGGSPDGTNANAVRLKMRNLDTSFSNYKVYSIFRSSLDGEAVAYVIADGSVPANGEVDAIDDGAPLATADVTSLLFLGGRDVIAGTMTEKDNTLFLGDITSAGIGGYDEIEEVIHRDMFTAFEYGKDNEAVSVSFFLTDIGSVDEDAQSIELEPMGGFYAYRNQLQLTSSQIQSFKGGEKYRFALMFRTANGVSSKSFWIGDKVNTLYPVMVSNIVRRPIARCTIPSTVVDAAIKAGYTSVTLMIAKADASDRKVLAQGIINPTMFNVWDRYKNRLYSYSSWITRPRHSGFANRHFEPVKNSTSRYGELQCNYWSGEGEPTPYYRIYTMGGTNAKGERVLAGSLSTDAIEEIGFTHYMLVYYVRRGDTLHARQCCGGWVLLLIRNVTSVGMDKDYLSPAEYQYLAGIGGKESYSFTSEQYVSPQGHTLQVKMIKHLTNNYSLHWNFWNEEIYNPLLSYLDASEIINSSEFTELFNSLTVWSAEQTIPEQVQAMVYLNANSGYHDVDVTGFEEQSFVDALTMAFNRNNCVWFMRNQQAPSPLSGTNKYKSSYKKKNLFFVDENIITLNSPEFDYEQISVDKVDDVKLRIVGIAKVVGNTSDYTVETGQSKKAGENLIQDSFSTIMPSTNPDGLVAAPLFDEYGLAALSTIPEIGEGEENKLLDNSIDSADYNWNNRSSVWYWLYMWHKSGGIPGVRAGDGFKKENSSSSNDEDTQFNIDTSVESAILYSELHNKNVSNLRFSYATVYGDTPVDYDLEDLRQYTYTDSQYVSISVNGTQRSYNANVRQGVNMPIGYKYPICYTDSGDVDATNPKWFLGSNDSVIMSYKSSPHAVMSLGVDSITGGYNILPMIEFTTLNHMDTYVSPFAGEYDNTAMMSGGLLPWVGDGSIDETSMAFSVSQKPYKVPIGSLSTSDRYLFVGELYRDGNNSYYGGTSRAAIESNTFIIAGPQQQLLNGQAMTVLANQGDTYFQRWDCLKTKPYDTTEGNSVTDITSVMVETHVNIDGRYDNMRNQQLLASIDTTNFGHVNPVYSQTNDFFASNDYGDEHTVDAYRSTITWTKEKAPSADIDAWSHITLASTLNLDGDKGVCRALRRFQNSILAFQDRGIAEVLFNSRTQIATTEGVPIEIANSGKVDGKRYISNKYGCINKWSIAEGKNGLYFIDNTNKMIGMFNGQSISSLTSAAYLDIWMKEHNSLDIWNSLDYGNFVAYYDRVHSDVYFVGNDPKNPTIVFNEVLGSFTGFFDYKDVPMMANVGDRFVSFHTSPAGYNALWLQNEGLYNYFYGITKPFYMIWRIQPDPYGDKIWGSLEYRADFFKVLSGLGDVAIGEESPTGGQRMSGDAIIEGDYQPDATFNEVEVWNEYQSTGRIKMEWAGANSAETYPDIRKKFRIWRADIPRAQKNETNKYGLDRIRNPWVWLRIGMSYDKLDNMQMLQLHDINVKYYTNG